jgi:hypothetical protein
MPTPLPYSDLANQANTFMTGQAAAPYLANLPNYANMVGQNTTNIGAQLKGQLPTDVINQIGQQAAERGVSTGSPGSPNANSAYLRALGLNSQQQMQQGSQNLGTAIQQTPVPQLWNPMSLITGQITSNQALSQARLGQLAGQRQMGAGGFSIAGGQPGGAPTTGLFTSSNPPPGVIQGGNWGNTGSGNTPPPTDPALLAQNWWNSYGSNPQQQQANAQQQPGYWNTDAGLQNPPR